MTEPRSRTPLRDNEDDVLSAYDDGVSLGVIARKYRVSRQAVSVFAHSRGREKRREGRESERGVRWGAMRDRIKSIYRANPLLSSSEVAAMLSSEFKVDVTSGYVRATVKRQKIGPEIERLREKLGEAR